MEQIGEFQWLPREEDLKSNFTYRYAILDKWSRVSEIVKNLYLTAITSLTVENFRKYKFDVLIDTCEQPFYGKPSIEYHTFRIEDKGKEDLKALMDPFADLVHSRLQKGRKVLVHCFGGSSRSGSLVIAYLMKYHGLSLKEAFKLIEQRRPVVRPLNGFFRQLIEYEFQLFGECSTKMVQYTPDTQSVTITVPDFFLTEYKFLIDNEVSYAVKNGYYYDY